MNADEPGDENISPQYAKRSQHVLGRGLSALMGDAAPSYRASDAPDTEVFLTRSVPIHMVHANPNQPRKRFEREALEGLAESIRELGILQPVLVRPHRSKVGEYELIAGERRWQAAQIAGLPRLPCMVQDVEEVEVAERALTENLQREDLNPIEESDALFVLTEAHGVRQETLARRIGKSRSYVANLLRLRNLPDSVRNLIRSEHLTTGHAKILVGRSDAEALAERFVEERFSVRAAERLIQELDGKQGGLDPGGLGGEPAELASAESFPVAGSEPDGAAAMPPPDPPLSTYDGTPAQTNDGMSDGTRKDGLPDTSQADRQAMERELSQKLGVRTEIQERDGRGRITLHFSDLEQLERINELLIAS